MFFLYNTLLHTIKYRNFLYNPLINNILYLYKVEQAKAQV